VLIRTCFRHDGRFRRAISYSEGAGDLAVDPVGIPSILADRGPRLMTLVSDLWRGCLDFHSCTTIIKEASSLFALMFAREGPHAPFSVGSRLGARWFKEKPAVTKKKTRPYHPAHAQTERDPFKVTHLIPVKEGENAGSFGVGLAALRQLLSALVRWVTRLPSLPLRSAWNRLGKSVWQSGAVDQIFFEWQYLDQNYDRCGKFSQLIYGWCGVLSW